MKHKHYTDTVYIEDLVTFVRKFQTIVQVQLVTYFRLKLLNQYQNFLSLFFLLDLWMTIINNILYYYIYISFFIHINLPCLQKVGMWYDALIVTMKMGEDL
jgi:hypothetical protein